MNNNEIINFHENTKLKRDKRKQKLIENKITDLVNIILRVKFNITAEGVTIKTNEAIPVYLSLNETLSNYSGNGSNTDLIKLFADTFLTNKEKVVLIQNNDLSNIVIKVMKKAIEDLNHLDL